MAKARTRRPPGRRPAPKKRRSPPSRTQRLGRGPRKALSPHTGDIQGVILILFAVLLALGIWLHNGGKAGVFLALLFRGLFGYGAYAVPVLFAGLGLALFRRSAASACCTWRVAPHRPRRDRRCCRTPAGWSAPPSSPRWRGCCPPGELARPSPACCSSAR